MTKAKFDIYQHVTDRIIEAIESGKANGNAWQMPWHQHGIAPMNAKGGNFYRGVNVPLLWAEMLHHNWDQPYFATYKQWEALGAQVRKGEKSISVVFWKFAEHEDDNGKVKKTCFARAYRVFNCAQVDGWKAPTVTRTDETKIIGLADKFIAASGADIRHGGDRAFYRPSSDHIQMPDRAQFMATDDGTATEHYYSTLLHELTHWTGAERRCDREFGKRFGDDRYAAEELVAELGSAFMCHALQINPQPRDDHSHYIANWLRVLKNDKRAIFTASSKAGQAVDWLEKRYKAEDVEPVTEPTRATGRTLETVRPGLAMVQ